MTKLVSAGVKNLVLDLISKTDSLDKSGQPIPRTAFPKKYLRSVNYIRQKVLDQILVNYSVAAQDETSESAVASSCLFGEFQKVKTQKEVKVLSEEHTSAEVELDEKDIAALKFFYDERDELPPMTNETLDEFESILK